MIPVVVVAALTIGCGVGYVTERSARAIHITRARTHGHAAGYRKGWGDAWELAITTPPRARGHRPVNGCGRCVDRDPTTNLPIGNDHPRWARCACGWGWRPR